MKTLNSVTMPAPRAQQCPGSGSTARDANGVGGAFRATCPECGQRLTGEWRDEGELRVLVLPAHSRASR